MTNAWRELGCAVTFRLTCSAWASTMSAMMSAMVELVLTLRGEEGGLCLVFVGSLLISRSVRDLRVCSVELMIKTGARSCHITDQRLGCHRAVLFSSPVFATSAGV